ncbi:MAG TPA: FAD-dependent thymidylate synthase, partial [Acidimicrobiales bacterium]|nr:FAD-dependent thymidylate synthase [Acidimicrobiales bacterium]
MSHHALDVPYAQESWTSAEADILRRYFTNLDGPVFALVNLPEVVKGALFARYSRTAKSLRRLFLDEFVGDLDVSGDHSVDATVGLMRAEQLYEKVFFEYGDDSVAQLGGVHLACEQASNLLTKVLERGRLMAYMEKSTRYVAYDTRLPNGRYRYYRSPEVLASPLGARYVGDMDRLFDAYATLLPVLYEFFAARHMKTEGESDFALRQAIKAKAFDTSRGLLPSSATSNLGMYGSGQGYEAILLRMRAHPLPEARHYADMMLLELRKVIPSFLARVDRPDRGGEWVDYLVDRREEMDALVGRLFPEGRSEGDAISQHESVRLVDFDPRGEDKVIAAMCFAHSSRSEEDV